jgi:hypothetical protein
MGGAGVMHTPIWGHVEYRSVIYDQELVNRGRLFEVKLIFSSFEKRVRHGISQIGFHVRGYVNNLIFCSLIFVRSASSCGPKNGKEEAGCTLKDLIGE